MKGNMTVEAACIFPFCFLVLSIVCCLGLFCYNQAVLKLTGYEAILLTAKEQGIEGETLEEKVFKTSETLAGKRGLSVKELKTSVKVTSSKIVVTYSGTQSLLSIPFKVTAVYERTFPESPLRIARGIRGEGS